MKKSADKRIEARLGRLLLAQNLLFDRADSFASDRRRWRERELLEAAFRYGRLVTRYLRRAP